jgi:hypothetical protein
MSRGQQSKVVNAGLANSAADQTAASNALTATNADLGDYTNRLNAFAAANPYQAGGQFAQDQSQIASSAADTSSNAIQDSLARSTAASGENTGGVANNVAEAQRQATRDQATTMANADATRIGNKSAYDGSVLQASSLPADLQSRLYGSAIGGSNSALGVAGGAAQTPSFLDTLGNSLAKSLGTVSGTAKVGSGSVTV